MEQYLRPNHVGRKKLLPTLRKQGVTHSTVGASLVARRRGLMMKKLCMLVVSLLLVGQQALAQNFSVGPGITTGVPQPDVFLTPLPSEDILGPAGAVGAPPVLVLPGLGPAPPLAFNVDAFSYNSAGLVDVILSFDFSVDAFAVGAAGTAVAAEAPGFDAHTDVFSSTGAGFNVLVHDGDGSTPSVGPLGLLEGPANPSLEGVNGYDSAISGPPPVGGAIYWSADAASAVAAFGLSGADVLISPGVPGFAGLPALYATAPALGLGLFGADELDALTVFDVGTVGILDPGDLLLFSLAPGSASLAGYAVSPGDILGADVTGFLGILVPDVALGLAPGDNLNALSTSAVPVPPAALLFGSALFCLVLMGRRRQPR